MKKIVKGNIINPVNRLKTEVMHNSALIIEDGKIVEYIDSKEGEKKYTGYDIIDYSDKYIAPGFIDNHLHAPQVNQRARYGKSLMQWLTKYIFKAEENFSDPEIARHEIVCCINELIKNGTTTAVMNCSRHREATDILFNLCAESGLKVFAGKVMMDFNLTGEAEETTDKSLRGSYDLYKKWHGYDDNRLQYIFSPRFAPVCSENLLRELGKLSDNEKVYIQSHLAENKDEVDQVLDIFYGYPNYTEVYYRAGILGPRTIMAHCIHLSEQEYDIIKETDTRIAHCPSSNFFLKSGKFNLKLAEQKGLKIGLGTDVGAGPSFSMFDVMKSMNYMQQYHILPHKAYYYATLGNAELLGIDDTTGNFEKGKDADFIVIDILKNHPGFTYLNVEDLLAFLIYLGNSSFIEDVYVRGEKIKKVEYL